MFGRVNSTKLNHSEFEMNIKKEGQKRTHSVRGPWIFLTPEIVVSNNVDPQSFVSHKIC